MPFFALNITHSKANEGLRAVPCERNKSFDFYKDFSYLLGLIRL